MHSTTPTSGQGFLQPLISPWTSQMSFPQVGYGSNPQPLYVNVMREFMTILNVILKGDLSQEHILKGGITNLVRLVQKYVGNFPKSNFLENLLQTCRRAPAVQKPTALRIWVEIQNDPEVLLMEYVSQNRDTIPFNDFKKTFIDTLYELRSEQYYDMLRIRNDLVKGLPNADFTDLDRELNRRPFIRNLLLKNPELCPTATTDQGQSVRIRGTVTNGQRRFPNETTPSTSTRGTPTFQFANPEPVVKNRPSTYATPNRIKEAIRKFEKEIELFFIPTIGSMSTLSLILEQSVNTLVKVVKDCSTTPKLHFDILNYLTCSIKYQKAKPVQPSSKLYGKLVLWTICKSLLSFQNSVLNIIRSSLNVSRLQSWFIYVFSRHKKMEYQEFVAIRQQLGRSLHFKLDDIDKNAINVRGISDWIESVARQPLTTLEDWIYPNPKAQKENQQQIAESQDPKLITTHKIKSKLPKIDEDVKHCPTMSLDIKSHLIPGSQITHRIESRAAKVKQEPVLLRNSLSFS